MKVKLKVFILILINLFLLILSIDSNSRNFYYKEQYNNYKFKYESAEFLYKFELLIENCINPYNNKFESKSNLNDWAIFSADYKYNKNGISISNAKFKKEKFDGVYNGIHWANIPLDKSEKITKMAKENFIKKFLRNIKLKIENNPIMPLEFFKIDMEERFENLGIKTYNKKNKTGKILIFDIEKYFSILSWSGYSNYKYVYIFNMRSLLFYNKEDTKFIANFSKKEFRDYINRIETDKRIDYNGKDANYLLIKYQTRFEDLSLVIVEKQFAKEFDICLTPFFGQLFE